MADEYADLPDWVRPGLTCDMVSWSDSSRASSIYRATIDKITKLQVVVSFTVRDTPQTARHRRGDIGNDRVYGSEIGRTHGGSRLLPLGTAEAADLRAVLLVRHLQYTVGNLYAARGRGSVRAVGQADQKPLKTAVDALDLLAEIEAEIIKVRQCIAGHAMVADATQRHVADGA